MEADWEKDDTVRIMGIRMKWNSEFPSCLQDTNVQASRESCWGLASPISTIPHHTIEAGETRMQCRSG
jgi:hypothetical protein